jgi:hypothetical protein
MIRHGHWIRTVRSPEGGWFSNDAGVSRVSFIPSHPDPGYNYLYDYCSPAGGFQKVRIVLFAKLNSAQTRSTLTEARYVFTVAVRGNCAAARRSQHRAREIQKELYG